MWPDRRLLDLLKIEVPILQAPMAGAQGVEIAIGASEAGALGSLPCAMLSVDTARDQVQIVRQRVSAPLNLNFFVHAAVEADPAREAAWRSRLAVYYKELELAPDATVPLAVRMPFDAAMCALVEELRPEVVSFHFGLPEKTLLARLKAAGCIVIASATIVREAVWLEDHGADAVIAQGFEAGGHRGMFLTDNIAQQPGLMALLPQVVDAVNVPVIAAGGIADGRGIAAAFALGASGVQIGSAYIKCPESLISAPWRAELASATDESSVITNVMTGRPARGIVNRLMAEVGPLSPDAPAFPHAATALAPLKAVAERNGKVDFSNVWTGQGVALAKPQSAADLTRHLAQDALAQLSRLGRSG